MGRWKQEPQSLMPTAEPTKGDVLFFAGFYEGEGSARKKASGGITILVPQKDPEILVRGRSLWGGSIRRPSGRDINVWVLSGDRARHFLIAIYPYLSARRKKQVEDANGLSLTGKKGASFGGVSPERRAAREMMTQEERHKETCRRWTENNRERNAANARKWVEKNRERRNEIQRQYRARKRAEILLKSEAVAENLERRPLVN